MIANLYIQASWSKGITQLKNSYFSPPFKVMNITEDKTAKQLQLMLMNSSPGILDGDSYQLKIDLDANTSVQLHTQSYQRIFNMKNSARQTMEVCMQKNSSFAYLPHPSVPHKDSDFTARNKIYLEENCSLIWGEVLTCGRMLNGEVFLLNKYHNITEIYFQGNLFLKENLLIQPLTINVQSLGLMEQYTHQASFIFVSQSEISNSLMDSVQNFLMEQKEINFGISSIAPNNLIVRILGFKAEQLHTYLKEIANIISLQNNFNPNQNHVI